MNSYKYLFAIQYLEDSISTSNLTELDIKKMNKMARRSNGIEFLYSVGKIYAKLLSNMDLEKIEPNLLLEV
jgi:hypothetical protein